MQDYFEKLEIYVGKRKVLILKILFTSILLATVLIGSVLKIIDNPVIEWSIIFCIGILAIASVVYMTYLEKFKDKIIENRGNEEMELKKIINVRVFSITAEELEELKRKQSDGSFTCADRQCFILKTEDKYIAVDNSAGDLFIEEFKYEDDAYIWLSGFKESEPLQAAEQENFWY